MNKIIISRILALCVLFACFFFVGCIHNNSATATPTDKPSTVDTDKDGIPNVSDPDIDGDGIPNNQDPDIDGDGIPNDKDLDPNGNVIPNDTANQYIPGLGVVSVDTVGYTLSLSGAQKNGTTTSMETIDLNKIRDEIKKNDIALSTFSITDLSIIASGSNNFITDNKNTRIVVKVFYLDQGNNKNLVLESAAKDGLAGPVLTMGDLAQGIGLNKEIFGASEGFSGFSDMIKDESKASVATVIEITFLDDPIQGTTDLSLNFILKASGKKAS